MEQFPERNEHKQMERPILTLDLSNNDGDIVAVILYARALLEGDELEAFRQEIQATDTTIAWGGKPYEDVLATVDAHVELIDLSNTFPQYGREGKIVAAVARLNEQVLALSTNTPCCIDGMYPSFEDPNCSPERYIVALKDEVEHTEHEINQCDDSQREDLERYKAMLLECVVSLQRYGVT